MSTKCLYLKKYLSRNLLKCYLYTDYESLSCFIEYNYYMFNASQEWNNSFATMNKITCLKNPVLVQSN